eukprot:gene14778-14909_t
MSGMIAQRIALEAEDRVKSVIAITPVPACGSPAPEEILAFLEDAAVNNDQSAGQIIGFMTSGKLPMRFADYKVKEWRRTSIPQARAAYLHMFSQTNFADQIKGLKTPFLVITGGHDAEGYSEPVMRETFLKWYPNAELTVIANSGHYPMQETPLYLLKKNENTDESLKKKAHQYLEKLNDAYERNAFNKALAFSRELARLIEENTKSSSKAALKEALTILIKTLAPITPHLCHELWDKLYPGQILLKQKWPEIDKALAAVDEITIAVQVNGKLRGSFMTAPNTPQQVIEEKALSLPHVITILEGQKPKRVIVIPNRIVNVVI